MDYYPSIQSGPSLLRTLASFVLRSGAGALLLVRHAWPQLVLGWRHIWEKTDWPLVGMLDSLGVPLPEIVTPVVVFVGASAVAGMALGLLTRACALVLLTLAALSLPLAAQSPSPFAVDAALLHGILFAVLFLIGPGRISLDHALSGSSQPAKPPRSKPQPKPLA